MWLVVIDPPDRYVWLTYQWFGIQTSIPLIKWVNARIVGCHLFTEMSVQCPVELETFLEFPPGGKKIIWIIGPSAARWDTKWSSWKRERKIFSLLYEGSCVLKLLFIVSERIPNSDLGFDPDSKELRIDPVLSPSSKESPLQVRSHLSLCFFIRYWPNLPQDFYHKQLEGKNFWFLFLLQLSPSGEKQNFTLFCY